MRLGFQNEKPILLFIECKAAYGTRIICNEIRYIVHIAKVLTSFWCKKQKNKIEIDYRSTNSVIDSHRQTMWILLAHLSYSWCVWVTHIAGFECVLYHLFANSLGHNILDPWNTRMNDSLIHTNQFRFQVNGKTEKTSKTWAETIIMLKRWVFGWGCLCRLFLFNGKLICFRSLCVLSSHNSGESMTFLSLLFLTSSKFLCGFPHVALPY